MDIAGGIYREICEVPSWEGVWGSGLRAAVTISRLTSAVTLHGYFREPSTEIIRRLEPLGVRLQCHPRSRDIAFAYFHPLSDPFIEPRLREIQREAPLDIQAKNILRFGFLEGSARVTGSRVIYDPQSPHAPETFSQNGSSADELALVMNEQEFKAYSKSDDLDSGARDIMESRAANVVVVKRGVFGALVYSSIGAPVEVPVYLSSRVFKIGTGDVFSGVFAHFWAQERRNPVQAADLASRAVATYCEDPVSPIDAAGLEGRQPVKGSPPLAVEIYGAADTLGRRYTLQEALYCLRSLGVDASIAADALPGAGERNNAVGLVIADGVSDESLSALNTVLGCILVLDEEHRPLPPDIDRVRVSDDFASAIYQICMKRP